MPIFWLLVVIGLVILWFLLCFAYKPIGRIVSKLFKDVKDTIKEEEKEDE